MASHPPKAIDMVVAAIVGLKERDGASAEAITKYIGANYEIDMAKNGPHIRRALKNGATQGKLISTKKGLFKVSPAVASASMLKQEKAKASKKVVAKKIKTSTASKLVRPKPPSPKKATTAGKPKKKGPVSSKPKTKKSKGGKKSGKKQQGKKPAGKKGGKKK